jgi:hypothetical protein
MKFLRATSGNVFFGLTEQESEIEPVIELVISVSEKRLQAVGGGVVQAAAFEDYRIGLSLSSARSLIESVQDFVKEAERQFEKIEVKCD